MSGQLKYKNKFIKKKVLEKRLKSFAAMRAGRIAKKLNASASSNNVPGRRIVELDILADNLECHKCGKELSLKNIVEETHSGLNSILHIVCCQCSEITEVPTGKTHTTKNNHKHSDINTKVVFGAIHSGIGCTGLNKLLACLSIPTISEDLYKQYESEIAPVLEEAEKESRKKSAEEEQPVDSVTS